MDIQSAIKNYLDKVETKTVENAYKLKKDIEKITGKKLNDK